MKRDKAFFFVHFVSCLKIFLIFHLTVGSSFVHIKVNFSRVTQLICHFFFTSSPFCLKQLVRTFKQTHKTFEVFEIQEILKLNMKFSHKIELNFILFDYIVFELLSRSFSIHMCYRGWYLSVSISVRVCLDLATLAKMWIFVANMHIAHSHSHSQCRQIK